MKTFLIQNLPRLRRFAFSLTGDISDADDLVQNTIERLISKSSTPDSMTLSWLFTVCKNCWIDEIRRRKVRETDNTIDTDALSDATQLGQDDLLELNELLAAVERLPDVSREALSMVAIAGLSYAETAEALDIPIGTVMSRIARARAMLADRLNAETKTQGGRNALH